MEQGPRSEPIVLIDLGVGGVTCEDCVRHATEALASVPGGERAEVSLATRRVVVEARTEVTTTALVSAVRGRGSQAFERRRRRP